MTFPCAGNEKAAGRIRSEHDIKLEFEQDQTSAQHDYCELKFQGSCHRCSGSAVDTC